MAHSFVNNPGVSPKEIAKIQKGPSGAKVISLVNEEEKARVLSCLQSTYGFNLGFALEQENGSHEIRSEIQKLLPDLARKIQHILTDSFLTSQSEKYADYKKAIISRESAAIDMLGN